MARTWCAGTLAFAALCSATALAGAQAARPAPEFGTAITVVSLPVFVTDPDGRAVAGLTREQIEVEDDGKRVAIVGFREIDAAGSLAADDVAESPAARRQFMLLFDLSFTDPNGLVRARRAARTFVDTGLGPTDLAAVATLSANHGLELLVGFTSDRSQLRRAVSSSGTFQVDRRADPLGLVYDLTDVGSAFADAVSVDGRRMESLAPDDTQRQLQLRFREAERLDYRQRTRGFFQGLSDLARSLDGLQGRKQVILLSAGFDATALQGESTQDAILSGEAVSRGRYWEVRSDDRFGDASLRSELEAALRTFSTSDSVVHAVDVTGLVSRGDARLQSPEAGRGSRQESLAQIASLAGGRVFKNGNDIGAFFDDILEMSRHYYLLAFEPPQSRRPGRFHKLKVRYKGKGRVSHRSGYFERAAFAERTPLQRQFEASELVAKGITGGVLGLKALAIPYRDAQGQVTLPVVIAVDGPSLLDGAGKERLGLEMYGYAIDADNRAVDFVAVAKDLSLARVREPLRERGLQCHAVFALSPGRYTLRFLVRDGETGRSGATWLEVNVPAFDPEGVMLFPPLFMEEAEGLIVVRAVSRLSESAVSPFRVGSDAFIPSARPRVTNGKASSVCLLAFEGENQYDPGASFEIRSRVTDASGQAVSAGRFELTRSLGDDDGFRRFIMSFTPEGLTPGDYTLRVGLVDPASGRVSEAYQAVRVQ